MSEVKNAQPDKAPEWFTGKTVNEPLFCSAFLEKHRLAYTENAFFSPSGKVMDENVLRSAIYALLEPFIVTGLSKKVDDIMTEGKREMVRSRFPVPYNPDAKFSIPQ